MMEQEDKRFWEWLVSDNRYPLRHKQLPSREFVKIPENLFIDRIVMLSGCSSRLIGFYDRGDGILYYRNLSRIIRSYWLDPESSFSEKQINEKILKEFEINYKPITLNMNLEDLKSWQIQTIENAKLERVDYYDRITHLVASSLRNVLLYGCIKEELDDFLKPVVPAFNLKEYVMERDQTLVRVAALLAERINAARTAKSLISDHWDVLEPITTRQREKLQTLRQLLEGMTSVTVWYKEYKIRKKKVDRLELLDDTERLARCTRLEFGGRVLYEDTNYVLG